MCHGTVKGLKSWKRFNFSLILFSNSYDSFAIFSMHMVKKGGKIGLEVRNVISDFFLLFGCGCCLFGQPKKLIRQRCGFIFSLWITAILTGLINRRWSALVIVLLLLHIIHLTFYFHLITLAAVIIPSFILWLVIYIVTMPLRFKRFEQLSSITIFFLLLLLNPLIFVHLHGVDPIFHLLIHYSILTAYHTSQINYIHLFEIFKFLYQFTKLYDRLKKYAYHQLLIRDF